MQHSAFSSPSCMFSKVLWRPVLMRFTCTLCTLNSGFLRCLWQEEIEKEACFILGLLAIKAGAPTRYCRQRAPFSVACLS